MALQFCRKARAEAVSNDQGWRLDRALFLYAIRHR